MCIYNSELYVSEKSFIYSVEDKNPNLKLVEKSKKHKKLSDGAIRLYDRIVFRRKLYGYCFEKDLTFAN